MGYKEIKGDLVKLACDGVFDVVAQGNNCFCMQGAGLAPQFVRAFGTDKFTLESNEHKGNINKLGTIDFEWVNVNDQLGRRLTETEVNNAITQYPITY